jgi:hypothetical protein
MGKNTKPRPATSTPRGTPAAATVPEAGPVADLFGHLARDLRPVTRLVLVSLHLLGPNAKFPGIRPLSTLLSVSRTTVRMAICELVEAGLVSLQDRRGSGPRGLVAGAKVKLEPAGLPPDRIAALQSVFYNASGRRGGRLRWMPEGFDAGEYLAARACDRNPRTIPPVVAASDDEVDLEGVEDPSPEPVAVIEPVPTMSPEPATEPEAHPPVEAKPARKPRVTKPKLTPEQMQAIATDSDVLKNYICYGAAAVGHPNPESLPPTSLNFLTPGYDTLADGAISLHHGKWGPQHFAGYYWYVVGWHREMRAQYSEVPGAFEITLPAWPKLIGLDDPRESDQLDSHNRLPT